MTSSSKHLAVQAKAHIGGRTVSTAGWRVWRSRSRCRGSINCGKTIIANDNYALAA